MDSSPAQHVWCNGCEQMLPREAFYERSDRPGQLLTPCRACRVPRDRARYLARRPKPRPKPPTPTEKWCSGCERTRPISDFPPRGDQAGVRSRCRECKNAKKRRYNEETSEARSEYQRRYYQENAEACGKRTRASIAKKPEKYRQIHSDWKKSHKDAVNASTHKRRALLASGGSWTDLDWQRLKAQCDWRCLRCGKQEVVDGITLCFDHVVPLSLGGLNTISNGQPLCKSCNSTKHRKVVDLRK